MSNQMPAAERAEKAEKAVGLSARGVSYVEIGKRLGISRQLASNLVKEELATRAEHRDNDRERAIAHYQQIIGAAWRSYEAVDDRSLNKSGHLNAAIRAQERIDRITGAEAPKKAEITSRTTYDVVWEDVEEDALADG